ncbi:ribonuclease HII [bacterium]|nr:ribonuclease HII [bacterium]
MNEAGIDEAGRGALAGPVVAACVFLNEAIPGLGDSKTIPPARRKALVKCIYSSTAQVGVGVMGAAEVDKLGIVEATMRAMGLAWQAAGLPKEVLVVIDGNDSPKIPAPMRPIPKADRDHKAVGAASLVAKVSRDAIMHGLDKRWSGYGLGVHMGYGTERHRRAIEEKGPTPCHRRSFRPVAFSLLVGGGA